MSRNTVLPFPTAIDDDTAELFVARLEAAVEAGRLPWTWPQLRTLIYGVMWPEAGDGTPPPSPPACWRDRCRRLPGRRKDVIPVRAVGVMLDRVEAAWEAGELGADTDQYASLLLRLFPREFADRPTPPPDPAARERRVRLAA